MAQITVIRTCRNLNATDNPNDVLMTCEWDICDTITRITSSGAVEVLLTQTMNATQCEVAIRDRVAADILQQTGRVMEVSQTFQHALRRG
jgi:hypothetical protein